MRVRYLVNDVEEAVDFYVSKLGFGIEKNFAPAIAILVHGDPPGLSRPLLIFASGGLCCDSMRPAL